MKHFGLFSLFTVLVFLASSAHAQLPSRTVETPAGLHEPVEVTPMQHAAHSTGPIIVNWHFKKVPGSANLIVNPDGTYLFSGNYKPARSGKIIDVVLVLRSHVGATYLFRYVADVSRGDVQWSKEGKSTILREDFKLFAPGHEWSGAYTFHLDAEANKILRENEKQNCENIVAGDKFFGWSFSYAESLGLGLGLPKYCQQFNAAWHN